MLKGLKKQIASWLSIVSIFTLLLSNGAIAVNGTANLDADIVQSGCVTESGQPVRLPAQEAQEKKITAPVNAENPDTTKMVNVVLKCPNTPVRIRLRGTEDELGSGWLKIEGSQGLALGVKINLGGEDQWAKMPIYTSEVLPRGADGLIRFKMGSTIIKTQENFKINKKIYSNFVFDYIYE